MNTVISDDDAIQLIQDGDWEVWNAGSYDGREFIECKLVVDCEHCTFYSAMCSLYRFNILAKWVKENKYPFLFI